MRKSSSISLESREGSARYASARALDCRGIRAQRAFKENPQPPHLSQIQESTGSRKTSGLHRMADIIACSSEVANCDSKLVRTLSSAKIE